MQPCQAVVVQSSDYLNDKTVQKNNSIPIKDMLLL